jgi:hypothetical protein
MGISKNDGLLNIRSYHYINVNTIRMDYAILAHENTTISFLISRILKTLRND